MPTLADLVRTYRAELAAGEREAARRLVVAYATAWEAIAGDLAALTAAIEDARRAGVPLTPAILTRGKAAVPRMLKGETLDEAAERVRRRHTALRDQVATELARYGRFAGAVVEARQREAIAAALRHAEGLTAAALGPGPAGVAVSFNRLHTEALTDLVGALDPATPLGQLLARFGQDAARAASEALVRGVARGMGPREIARELAAKVEYMGLTRARLLSRQEYMRAFRSASTRAFQSNPAVRGWRWRSARTARTCGVCWAMDGSEHEAGELMQSHLACRCVQVPIVRSWAELGFPDIPDIPQDTSTGPELFARLPAETRRSILGQAKARLYDAGELDLASLVAVTRDARWGDGLRERALWELAAELETREAAD